MVSSTTTTTPGPIEYQVKAGDNLTKLAKFFGLTPTFLANFNHLGNADSLTVGQVLQVPRRPPIRLVVMPPDGPAGETFNFNLTGAAPQEMITFEIDGPGNSKFTGPPHMAADDGSVSTTFQSGATDLPGVYSVLARGDQGSMIQATFRITPTPTS